MTRENLRARVTAKFLKCELCKEFEFVRYLFFECIVCRQLWIDVFEVFGINVTNFESIASRWRCNKTYMHFNVGYLEQ